MNNPPAFPSALNAIAFCILMDHHGDGIESAHPDYVSEKMREFQAPEPYAVAMLDQRNQTRLRSWCKMWNYQVPEELETWLKAREQ